MNRAVLVFCLMMSSSLWAQQLSVSTVLADIPDQSSSEIRISQLEKLLAQAKQKQITILTLLYEIQSFIAHKNAEVAISGPTLRTLGEKYSIGNDRIKAFFPIEKIVSLQMNSPSCDLRVALSSTHKAVVDLGSLTGTVILPLSYGICSIEDDYIRDFRGIILKKGIINASITSMEYSQHSDEIAVDVKAPIFSPTVRTTIGVIQ